MAVQETCQKSRRTTGLKKTVDNYKIKKTVGNYKINNNLFDYKPETCRQRVLVWEA